MLIACGLTVGLGLAVAAETKAADDALLRPTPLILKDGRIANVSVHTLAFAPGQSTLGPVSTQRLGDLTREMATDCFLTAQVIGHVDATEVGNDTLSAHRLARARADAVQASLIAGGLPAKAIASVWDWQFMVREPRATVWMFSLTPGEDCNDVPLESAAPALVARAESPASPAPASEARPALAPKAPPQPGAAWGVPSADPVASASGNRDAPPTASTTSDHPLAPVAAARAAEPAPVVAAVPAGPSRPQAEIPSVIQALPAVSPSTAKALVGPPEPRPATVAAGPTPATVAAEPTPATVVADARPAAVVAEARPASGALPEVVAALPERAVLPPVEPAAAEHEAPVDAAPDALVITFPSNSSYFPPGTSTQLGAVLEPLAKGQRYEVVLQSSISASDKVVGAETAEEAAQYNKWLAERRIERVRDWLEQNDDGRALVITPEYRANDESRQLVVRVIPTG